MVRSRSPSTSPTSAGAGAPRWRRSTSATATPTVPRPPKELKGFAKVKLGPGQTKRVQIVLSRRAFSWFDEKTMQWETTPGEQDILVGSSSQQIELRGKTTVK